MQLRSLAAGRRSAVNEQGVLRPVALPGAKQGLLVRVLERDVVDSGAIPAVFEGRTDWRLAPTNGVRR